MRGSLSLTGHLPSVLHASLFASILAATACTPKMAYPPVAGPSSGGIGTADDAPGPQVMAEALKAVARRNGDEVIAYSLPSGLRESSWSRVDRALDSGSRRAEPGTGPFYSVESVRVDGGTATVEVAAPRDGFYQLYTVRLVGGGFDSFRVTNVQPWTIRYDPPTVHAAVGRASKVTAAAEGDQPSGS
jgi:hypothetical protein